MDFFKSMFGKHRKREGYEMIDVDNGAASSSMADFPLRFDAQSAGEREPLLVVTVYVVYMSCVVLGLVFKTVYYSYFLISLNIIHIILFFNILRIWLSLHLEFALRGRHPGKRTLMMLQSNMLWEVVKFHCRGRLLLMKIDGNISGILIRFLRIFLHGKLSFQINCFLLKNQKVV